MVSQLKQNILRTIYSKKKRKENAWIVTENCQASGDMLQNVLCSQVASLKHIDKGTGIGAKSHWSTSGAATMLNVIVLELGWPSDMELSVDSCWTEFVSMYEMFDVSAFKGGDCGRWRDSESVVFPPSPSCFTVGLERNQCYDD